MTEIPRETVIAAARALHLDVVTAEVVHALEEAGIKVILLKGPSILKSLYGTDHRPYIDIDLLVDPNSWSSAVVELEAIGFTPVHPGALRSETAMHSKEFQRDKIALDVHYTLSGAGVSDDEVWSELLGRSAPVRVAGRTVDGLDEVGLAVHIALHAVQDGKRTAQTLEDLHRAVVTFSSDVWFEARKLARRLKAEDHFAAGLRLIPLGERLAADLSLDVPSRLAQLKSSSAPGDVIWMAQLASMPSFRSKLGAVLREAFPTPGGLRVVSPVARKGPAGLGVAYLARPFSVVFRGATATVRWAQASRRLR